MIKSRWSKIFTSKDSVGIYKEQILHRLITYPLSAICTYLIYWYMSHHFINSLFNFYLTAWMLVGLSQIIEYALGVQVMNKIILQGYTQESRILLLNSVIYLVGMLTLIGILGLFTPLRDFGENYLASFSLELEDQYPIMLVIFLSVVFLSGASQLASRILLGLGKFRDLQYISLFGYVISVVILFVFKFLEIGISFQLAYAVSLSPIAFTLIPLSFVIAKYNMVPTKIFAGEISRYTGFGYGITYAIVSFLSAFCFYLPRAANVLRGNELTQFLLCLTVIAMFINVSSSVSQVLWRSNLSKVPEWDAVVKSYSLVALWNLAILPFFGVAIFLTFNILAVDFEMRDILELFGLGYLFFFFANLHMISSSLLISRRDLKASILFLISQAIALSVIIRLGFNNSPSDFLFTVTSISIVFANLPTFVYLRIRMRSK